MKQGMVILAVAACVLMFAPSADACAAAYVKAIGNNDGSTYSGAPTVYANTQHVAQEASDVARGFIDWKGVDPDSPAGQVIHPYMEGVARYEHNQGDFDLANDTVATNIAKACNTAVQPGHHFQQHWGAAVDEAGDIPTQIQSSISGG